MARFKKFDSGKKISEYEELGFELADEEFTCYPAVPGAVFLDYIAEADSDGGTGAALYKFLKAAMPEDQYERLNEVLHNPEVIIEIETIAEVVKYLVEEYSSRPTQGLNT